MPQETKHTMTYTPLWGDLANSLCSHINRARQSTPERTPFGETWRTVCAVTERDKVHQGVHPLWGDLASSPGSHINRASQSTPERTPLWRDGKQSVQSPSETKYTRTYTP
eukprot:2728710-Amphidinium_carterae.1